MSTKTNSKLTDAVQKQLLRGTQKPINKHQATVKTHTSPSFYQQNKQVKNPCSTGTVPSHEKYRIPQLQTTLGLAQRIDNVKAKSGPKYKDVGDLTPRSKAVVTEHITHQLNFRTDATVFKKLIPVNVNDSVLEEMCPKVKKRKSYTRQDKDPEPVIGDYLTPIVPLELKIERCDSAIELKGSENFNYNRMYEFFNALNAGL